MERVAVLDTPFAKMASSELEPTTPTVCRMSPIWQVTAVQGRVPINAPAAQSRSETPVNPQAMLSPDQGTIPMRRNTDNLTHAGVAPVEGAVETGYFVSSIDSEVELEPSKMDRVT